MPTIALHWAVALGVIGLLAFGFWLGSLPKGPDENALIQVHKSFGLLVFAFALTRIVWRTTVGFPEAASSHAAWERAVARLVHYGLLAATVIMPISGIVRSLAYARPVGAFGVQIIPQVFEVKHEELYDFASAVHEWTAWSLLALVFLHVCGAAKHHLLDGDGTVRRMLALPPPQGPDSTR